MRGNRRHGTRRPDLEARYLRAAVIATVVFAIGAVVVFTRQSLFGGGYQLRAVLSSVSQVRNGSEVRISGIKVGQIDGISPGPGNTSVVAMTIGDAARPIHSDATVTLRPRLLLEGNGYLDLDPGSPGAPELRGGATIPLSQTAVSVQLDQVLDVFDSPTRGSLQRSIAGLASGLGPDTGSPTSKGSGYGGLRTVVRQLDTSLVSITQVAHAARGTTPGDLGRAIGSSGNVTAQLAQDPRALADSVTGFDRLMGALAAEDQPLASSIAGFDELLKIAPPSLTQIDAALPSLTRFANALRPALYAAPVTLTRTNRLLDQIGAVVAPSVLPRLLHELTPVTAQLPALEQRLRTLFGYTTPVTDCINTHVVPTLNTKMQDGATTTGDPAWLDLLHAVTGFTSASTSFDGNAGTFRAGLAFGSTALQGVLPGLGNVVGQLDPNVEGVRPVWLGYGVEPPYRPDQPCASQAPPNLNAESGPSPSWDLHVGTRAGRAR
jgi:ABC-type transporter Mla subunit MlaD